MGWSDRAAGACRTCALRFLRLAIWLSILVAALCPGAVAADTCQEWAAKVVSVQGSVEAQRAGEAQWQPVRLYDTYCPGDRIRVQEHSRAALVLPNEAILRLDQKTTITFIGLEQGPISVLDLLSGAVHFFSRMPRGLKVTTPFVNAVVEGTEFFVKVEREQTFLSVFEGRVAATNEAGSLTLASGQSSVAQAGQAPALRLVVRPRDAVQWALYYPPILDYHPADFPGETAWQAMVRQSIQFYRQGDLSMAFDSIAKAPEDIQDPRFFTYRAALLLTVGRVDEASVDIERALQLDPRHAHAFALQSVIAVVQNNKDEALNLARQAVKLDPASSAAQVALSYAQQARFDLRGALASLQKAVQLHPDNALAWARLAELRLSIGQLKKALDAAQKAVALHPNLARTQTVLGFAFLTQMRIREAQDTFARAIELEQAAPLARLGLGLAKIRQGKLQEGRGEIEIAVSLDPNNSLIRSYLGKAYYEEKRDKLARDQFATAKELDPFDPTPWFYDAIRKQTVNRPVEALHDLQRSIELNDNRAVYRSRLLLDADLAARSASLARLYHELGFQQLALVEGWKSLNIDPGNYSAHRFLADTYAALPRHGIARSSELLQSQLLQPINITPVPPQLAESELIIPEGLGPAAPSLNEFNPLFVRNRFALLASGIAGENDTLGDEVVHSGVWGRLSYSLGQYHYETDGFRKNNDLTQDLYNAFIQVSLSYNISVQAEFRYTDTEEGDRGLRFFPDDFLPNLRQDRKTETFRLGLHHAFVPGSDIIASLIYKDVDAVFRDQNPDPRRRREATLDEESLLAEGQYLFRSEGLHIISGAGYFTTTDRNQVIRIGRTGLLVDTNDIHHTNLYMYSQLNYLPNVTVTLGVSSDFFRGTSVDRDQVNPKVGLTWTPFPSTTLRAAAFRVLNTGQTSVQTIEPTQVAGFNQFFGATFEQDFVSALFPGIDAWRYGVGIDHKLSPSLYAGGEFSKQDLKVPGVIVGPGTRELVAEDWDEYLARAYVYWTPHPWLAASAEYQFERFERGRVFGAGTGIGEVNTHRLPLGINFFHPSGLSVQLKATYLHQDGKFAAPVIVDPQNPFKAGNDQFWLVDTAIRYRLPKRRGFITLGVKNLFDEQFKFQELDPATPTIQRDRLVFGRIALGF
jgi:tetratricopeptide (TPR) repeat protein